FAQATAAATEGDTRYRERDYPGAQASYQAALEGLLAIEASIPERLAALLEQARQAIETGDTEALQASLVQTALLAPDSAELATLQQRAQQLPAVLEALQAAADAEAAGDLAGALEALSRATTADPAHQRAAAERERVAALDTEQRFNRAMSEGYAALDDSRFSAAREAFRQAQALKPGSGEVKSALQELSSSETAHRLASLQRQGSGQEQAEDWQAAVASYEKALAIDPSVVYAQQGLARALPRAQLQQRLEEVIKKPERLSDPTVAATTGKLLAEARGASPAGPVLSGQIASLERLLAVASRPIAVTLRSDQQTSVTLYKVARLGQFTEHRLDLRPGTYTAVGTRNGYRDVRRTFTISPDTPPEPVVIACTEPI
ncbi:MAG: hypothetical protein ACK5HY_09460, partial [Parahaliea sp.]